MLSPRVKTCFVRYFWPITAAGIFLLSLVCIFTVTRAPKPDRTIACVAVSRTGRWIAAGTHAGAITICDQSRLDSCRTVRAGDGVLNDLQFSPDERLLAIADENLRLLAVDLPRSFFCYTRRPAELRHGPVQQSWNGTPHDYRAHRDPCHRSQIPSEHSHDLLFEHLWRGCIRPERQFDLQCRTLAARVGPAWTSAAPSHGRSARAHVWSDCYR